jgi:general secretion pathway protein A
MDFAKPPYEAFYGFVERPFSLTSDPRYYFRSRSHSRAFEALSAGINRRESLLLVTGDLGVGKTILCRTFLGLRERHTRAALVGNSLLSPEDLLRLLLQDLGAVSKDEIHQGRLLAATRAELQQTLDEFLVRLRASQDGAVLIIDEAHSLPAATIGQIVQLTALESNREKVLQIVLSGQPSATGHAALPRPLEERLSTRARLLPLERDECERYVHHRLAVAGGIGVTFSPRALDVIYSLSGGLPRLVNLLGERALQEAALHGARRVEPTMIESAATALQLLRLRPKRFRWFGAQAAAR